MKKETIKQLCQAAEALAMNPKLEAMLLNSPADKHMGDVLITMYRCRRAVELAIAEEPQFQIGTSTG